MVSNLPSDTAILPISQSLGILTNGVGDGISIFAFDGASINEETMLSVIPFPLGALKLTLFLFIPII